MNKIRENFISYGTKLMLLIVEKIEQLVKFNVMIKYCTDEKYQQYLKEKRKNLKKELRKLRKFLLESINEYNDFIKYENDNPGKYENDLLIMKQDNEKRNLQLISGKFSDKGFFEKLKRIKKLNEG